MGRGGLWVSYGKIAVLLFFLLAVISLSISAPAFATSEEEKSFLNMWFTEDELQIISTTRSLKSITRVAENVEVVTAEDIALMNAHTLADVLYTVNGVEVDPGGGPGSLATVAIQGSETRHVAVYVDGILINNLSDNFPDISSIPAQNIERIEIIKGPASSVWGSSLGGVINVITKGPGSKEKLSGTISASYGKDDTGDFRAETYGNRDAFGYYAYAGRLQSNGLTQGFDANENFAYAKMSYNFQAGSSLILTAFFGNNERGVGESVEDRENRFLGGLSFNTPLGNELSLNVFARASLLNSKFTSTGDGSSETRSDDGVYGATAKLTWKHGIQTVVMGSDYDYQHLSVHDIGGGTDFSDKASQDKWAVYINDTIVWNKFSITPGIRYDDSETVKNFVSPSLGITYELSKNTILRAYVARGFNSPTLSQLSMSNEFFGFQANPGLQPEKIWSYQLGIETGALKYLWLKLTAFRNDISDAIVPALPTDARFLFTLSNEAKETRQGFGIEFRTLSFYKFSFFGGMTYIHAENPDTDEVVKNIPTLTYDLGLRYDDGKSLRGLLKAHYIWWNADADQMGQYNSVIVDMNIIKSLFRKGSRSLECFLTAHNIFDGSQYLNFFFKNPGRWIEAGLSYRF